MSLYRHCSTNTSEERSDEPISKNAHHTLQRCYRPHRPTGVYILAFPDRNHPFLTTSPNKNRRIAPRTVISFERITSIRPKKAGASPPVFLLLFLRAFSARFFRPWSSAPHLAAFLKKVWRKTSSASWIPLSLTNKYLSCPPLAGHEVFGYNGAWEKIFPDRTYERLE